MSNPYSHVDVPRLLFRLGIQARSASGGRKFTACCPHPDHSDKSPSWFIHNKPGEPFHATFSCQGCGFKGGPVKLVEEVLVISAQDARVWLKDLTAPVPLPTTVEVEVRGPSNKFVAPSCFVFPGLNDWPEEHATYLEVERGLTAEDRLRWKMAVVSGECGCDKQRHAWRVILPVYDTAGIMRGYTCRGIRKQKVKYIEPKTEEGANKNTIYGSHLAGSARRAFVVEGPFDAIATDAALRLLGASNACALALRGSSPSAMVLQALSTFDALFVMTDPDVAGQKALEALSVLARHTEVVPVELPEGEDPSSLYWTKEHGDSKRYELLERMSKAVCL